MSFSWILSIPHPTPATAEALAELGAQQDFDSAEQADAWFSEVWENLADEGVEAVTLADDGHPVRPAMSLDEG